MPAPIQTGVLLWTLLAFGGGCSFPDPTFVDAAAGAGPGMGGNTTGGSSGSVSGATSGGRCAAGCEPQLVAEGQGEVIAIAANSTSVYWISKLEADNSAELRSALISEDGVKVLTSEGLGWSAQVLAVDQASAFVANQSSGGALVSLRLSDGAMAWDYMQERIDAIFLDATAIYYSSPYALVKLPKVGPASGGRLDLSDFGGPRLLLRDDEDLIVLDQSEQRLAPRRVVRLRSEGSQVFSDATVLLDEAPDFDSACADGDAYYFADADQGEIVRLSRASPSSVEPLAQQEAIPRNLQLRSGVLYWTTDSGFELRRMTTLGELPITVDDRAVPTVVATSSSGVFWATTEGIIKRLEP